MNDQERANYVQSLNALDVDAFLDSIKDAVYNGITPEEIQDPTKRKMYEMMHAMLHRINNLATEINDKDALVCSLQQSYDRVRQKLPLDQQSNVPTSEDLYAAYRGLLKDGKQAPTTPAVDDDLVEDGRE